MRKLHEKRGIVLVTALALTLISLIISMALLSFITMGTRMSASQKRYRSALSAAYGGVEISAMEIIPKIFNGYSSSSLVKAFSGSTTLMVYVSNECLQQKINFTSDKWTACGPDATIPSASQSPDFIFTLKGIDNNSAFNMKSKIFDTFPGNSDPSGVELDSGMSVAGTPSGISPKHIPALISIEVEGTQGLNPQEKAELSVLYSY